MDMHLLSLLQYLYEFKKEGEKVFLGIYLTSWVWIVLVALYAVFIIIITRTTQAVWKKQREDILKRRDQGANVCLELIMVDVSMFVIILLMPFLHIVKFLFCRRIK